MTDVIADGEDGRLVPFGDVDALAEAIVFLVDHPDVRATMGAKGARKVRERHTWARKHRLVRQFYLDLVTEWGRD